MRRRGALLFVLVARAAFAQGVPNLDVDRDELARSLTYDLVSFAPDHCALQPGDRCVDGPGARKLLRFGVLARNIGTADLVLGTPEDHPESFVFAPCHRHWHFDAFARYELRQPGLPEAVVTGQKRSFCVQDSVPVTAQPRFCTSDAQCGGRGRCGPGRSCRYDCTYQGIQVGYGDFYPRDLDCQWLDVTDVPPGVYDLRVLLNPAYLLPESDFDDDAAAVGVVIDGPSALHPAPRVKLRAPRHGLPRRVGRRLAVRWRVRFRGTVRLQEVWWSRDGGVTFDLLAGPLPPTAHVYRWTIPAEAATDAARVKVVAWSTDLQRGTARSRRFRIVR